jgi:hypothetical protein
MHVNRSCDGPGFVAGSVVSLIKVVLDSVEYEW